MSVPSKRHWQLRVERLVALGICVHCGKNPKTSTTLRCEACKARTAEYSRRHYRKMKAKSRRMSEGDYVDGATFSQIGLALGISRSRVEQIYHRAIKKLWRECKRQGIDPGMIIGRGFSAIALCEKWADG